MRFVRKLRHAAAVGIFVMLAALVAPAPAAVGQRPERPPMHSDSDAQSLAGELEQQSWRIHSFLFNVMPSGGHPIAFLADGRFESKHWKLSSSWSLTPDGELLLVDRTGRQVVRFTYDEELEVFVAYQDGRPEAPYAIIGREGTDLGRAFAMLVRSKK